MIRSIRTRSERHNQISIQSVGWRESLQDEREASNRSVNELRFAHADSVNAG